MGFLRTFIYVSAGRSFRFAFVCLSFAFRLPFVCLSFCFRFARAKRKGFSFSAENRLETKRLFVLETKTLFVCAFRFARLDSAPSGVMRAYNEPPDAVPIPVRRWAASARGGRLLAARPPSTRSLATSRSLASDRSTNQRSELG